MAKKNEQFLNLAKEIEKYSQDIAKEMAIYTREEINKSAESAIKKFYGHYDPEYYNRHLPIGGNIKKSFRKYYKNNHDIVFSGGIEISPEWMDDIYNTNRKKNYVQTDYIFNLIYAGYHGNVNMFPYFEGTVPPVMSPSPLDLILNKRDSIIKRANSLANKAAAKIKSKNKYSYIQ